MVEGEVGQRISHGVMVSAKRRAPEPSPWADATVVGLIVTVLAMAACWSLRQAGVLPTSFNLTLCAILSFTVSALVVMLIHALFAHITTPDEEDEAWTDEHLSQRATSTHREAA